MRKDLMISHRAVNTGLLPSVSPPSERCSRYQALSFMALISAHLPHVPAESMSALLSQEPVHKRQQARMKNRSLTFWFALAGHHHHSSSVPR
ncbi:hypothetical protein GQ55_8G030900 [Panicum hallii var. hallii]|uniref:Uncharacterized protein n=1 Tax=Panicum hallii var. hallii TaxID=1504633 RepID=A0A2T7CK51_9POAL|nr:hypothetical protein GQ55_8G030900 [Panicum hallii var. hallii]PUZ43725.1 hypothetical protein GQ55_8G030900 [Panicum hallii var. hallii]